MKHSSSEHTRKRIDPRRRQAALSFLSKISLDGRPVHDHDDDDADNTTEEDDSIEARTTRRQSLVSPERSMHAGAAATISSSSSTTTTAAQALAIASQALLLANNRASLGMGSAESDGDAFGPSIFSSPFSAVPAATRGRLQTYTQGVPPASYCRQGAQSYSLEGGQIANSAIELQRS
ncbi:hypothetical protein NHX12_004423, partial [Muraenolepis orangiensis]